MMNKYSLPDKNIVGPWKTFIYLKGIWKLEFKMSSIAKHIETRFFSDIIPNRGWSCQRRIIIILDLDDCQVQALDPCYLGLS